MSASAALLRQQGDAGGNFVQLVPPVQLGGLAGTAGNLHALWDAGVQYIPLANASSTYVSVRARLLDAPRFLAAELLPA